MAPIDAPLDAPIVLGARGERCPCAEGLSCTGLPGGYCAVACPYQARQIVHRAHFAYNDSASASEVVRADPKRINVATKCTFCVDRIDTAAELGLKPGVDPEVTPACVNSCIASALAFGDRDDPDSNVSQLLRENKQFRMHEELGTDPGMYYLWDKT